MAKADGTQRSPYARCTPITPLAAAEKGAAEGMLDGGVLKFIRFLLGAISVRVLPCGSSPSQPPRQWRFPPKLCHCPQETTAPLSPGCLQKSVRHSILSHMICYYLLHLIFFFGGGIGYLRLALNLVCSQMTRWP